MTMLATIQILPGESVAKSPKGDALGLELIWINEWLMRTVQMRLAPD
jgi:hypothetical protein